MNIAKCVIAAGVLLAAAEAYGCSREPTSTPVMLPNGNSGSVITCRLKSECFIAATRVCENGYYVLQANDQPANDFTSGHGASEYVIQCVVKGK